MTTLAHSSTYPAWLELDRPQLVQNLKTIRSMSPGCRIGLAIKANGYGHGLIPVAQCAESAAIDMLCVAQFQEGMRVREAGIEMPILLMGAIEADQARDIAATNLDVTVSSLFKAELLQRACEAQGCKIRVHLEVDTGMRRTGMRPETVLQLVQQLDRFSHLLPVGIYTHFATADCPDHPATMQQWRAFSALLEHPGVRQLKLIRHCANSAAFLDLPETHLDLVRIGLLAYGHDPFGGYPHSGIRPCLQLKAKVSFCKTVRAGEGISYGHRYRASQDTRVVTVPVGYGDGYPRALYPGGSVLIRGKRFPIAGTICMDQFMVDVGSEPIRTGEEVILLGSQGDEQITAAELAHRSQTIPWDILCRWTDRLPRL
jgi:alanine racemase